MAQPFDIDDLVWAKFLTYRPWPGRIIRKTIGLKANHLCVQFYGNDDHSEVLQSNIFPYLERVEDFTLNLPKNHNSGFYTAINTIHEKYWNLVDLKRNSEDTGFPVDTDEEMAMAIEDRKAGRWNPPVLRRPLPERYCDDSDSSEGDKTSGGKGKNKRLKKNQKGAATKQKGTAVVTKNSKKAGSKTITSCKASTSGQATKASTSGQGCVASTSGLKRKASTSSQESKVSSSSETSKTLTSSPKGKTSCRAKAKSSSSIATRSSVSSPVKERQLSVHLVRLSAEEIASQTAKTSTSKVNTRKRKASETVSLPKEEKKPSTSKASGSPSSSKESKVTPPSSSKESKVTPSSSSKESKVTPSSSSKETNAPQIRPSPFMNLTHRPADDIAVPQLKCTECAIRFGFIGLKRLSQILIYSLLKEGHIVNVWSKDASEFNALTNAGAKRTNTPAGIITSSDVIFYSTRDPDISKNILLTREGVFDGCARSLGIPKIFVELTSIDIVEPERSIRPLISYQGGYYLQMKAMIHQMKKDKPTFLCAGNERVYAAVVSCLYHITRDIHYFGTEFFKDAPLALTPEITQELVLQSLQNTSSFLFELGFDIPTFENILCHKDFDFGKVAAKLKEDNEAKRNEKIVFYQNM